MVSLTEMRKVNSLSMYVRSMSASNISVVYCGASDHFPKTLPATPCLTYSEYFTFVQAQAISPTLSPKAHIPNAPTGLKWLKEAAFQKLERIVPALRSIFDHRTPALSTKTSQEKFDCDNLSYSRWTKNGHAYLIFTL